MKTKVLRRALPVLLCVCMVCASLTLSAFAASSISFDDLLDTQYSNWSDLPEDFKNLGNAYAKFFTDSTLSSFFKNAANIPVSWFKVLKDGTPVLSPVHNLFYWLDEAGQMYVNNLDTNEGAHVAGGGGGRHRGDLVIPSETAKDFITEESELFYPKNTGGKMSYRTDPLAVPHINAASYYRDFSFFSGEEGFDALPGSNDMYMVLFYKSGSDNYYGKYQFHFTMTVEENWFEDRDEIEYYDYTLKCKYWDMTLYTEDVSSAVTEVSIFENSQVPYWGISHGMYRDILPLTGYSSYDNYFNNKGGQYWGGASAQAPLNTVLLSSADIEISIPSFELYKHFATLPSTHDETCSAGGCDFGYYASLEPISTKYDKIETSKIPDNYYITIQGDTLYDYSITNPETGQSDTINNYITNNYTYVTNNGGDNSGSGGISGNVIVGGKVDIGGSVGIDINVSVPDININVNTGNGSGGVGGSDLSVPNTDVFNSYYDEALDESSGFRRFLEEFFGFLPPEITLLLGIGLTFVILARIFGR